MCGKQRGCGRNPGSVATKGLNGHLNRGRNQAAGDLSYRAAEAHRTRAGHRRLGAQNQTILYHVYSFVKVKYKLFEFWRIREMPFDALRHDLLIKDSGEQAEVRKD